MIWAKPVLLVAAPFFLALGLVLPLLRFETLYFFSRNPSLLDIIAGLWQSGDRALATLVFLVSVAFPLVKLVGVAAEFSSFGKEEGRGSVMKAIVPQLSRWAMMDVMLVAIVIFAAKTGGLVDAYTQPGLWFYAGSALSAGLLHRLNAQQAAV